MLGVWCASGMCVMCKWCGVCVCVCLCVACIYECVVCVWCGVCVCGVYVVCV